MCRLSGVPAIATLDASAREVFARDHEPADDLAVDERGGRVSEGAGEGRADRTRRGRGRTPRRPSRPRRARALRGAPRLAGSARAPGPDAPSALDPDADGRRRGLATAR